MEALSFLAVIITVLCTIYIYKDKNQNAVASQQLKKAIAPSLDIMREHLFMGKEDYSTDSFKTACAKVQDLMSNSSYLFPYYLRLLFENFNFENDIEKKEIAFKKFSNELLSQYNDCCRACEVSGIPIGYRKKHNLYISDYSRKRYNISFWFNLIIKLILLITIAIIIGCLTFLVSVYIVSSLAKAV